MPDIAGEWVLHEKSGLDHTPFLLPCSETPRLAVGTTLLGFGGGQQQRGTIGDVKTIAVTKKQAFGQMYLEGDVGISSTNDDGKTRLTHLGDCGTILVDKRGHGLVMHHVLEETTKITSGGERRGTTWESFGVPLEKIFASHSLLGGKDDGVSTSQIHESSAVGLRSESEHDSEIVQVERKQSYDILYCPRVEFEEEKHRTYDIAPTSLKIVLED
ncbi:expressed unknown protein [Seminavis robusta]|uniref:Uncharacterized protein n=1 Tax=Seminavis robusta TaxID=568900 RepID=A0A9N8EV55_9STRA|nr:expressed unknown protein [Seminavis robusta]|eukprot:Sro1916_g305250.1 n/a (215) ;mRNA; f:18631-19275